MRLIPLQQTYRASPNLQCKPRQFFWQTVDVIDCTNVVVQPSAYGQLPCANKAPSLSRQATVRKMYTTPRRSSRIRHSKNGNVHHGKNAQVPAGTPSGCLVFPSRHRRKISPRLMPAARTNQILTCKPNHILLYQSRGVTQAPREK